jgi:hypothetical protein
LLLGPHSGDVSAEKLGSIRVRKETTAEKKTTTMCMTLDTSSTGLLIMLARTAWSGAEGLSSR